MDKDVLKANTIITTHKGKSSICKIMLTIIKANRYNMYQSDNLIDLKELLVGRVIKEVDFLQEIQGSSFIYSNSNFITKLLNKLEVRTTTTCTKRCKVSPQVIISKQEMNSHRQVESSTSTNQPIDI